MSEKQTWVRTVSLIYINKDQIIRFSNALTSNFAMNEEEIDLCDEFLQPVKSCNQIMKLKYFV